MLALITQVLTHLLDEDPNEFPCITLSEYVDVEEERRRNDFY